MSDAVNRCHDCNAAPGSFHQPGCDVECCPFCGGQLISCGCHGDADDEIAMAEWERRLQAQGLIPWTGVWPGEAECQEFGWYSYYDEARSRWIRCEKDHPEAGPDLNRLHRGEARWDRERKRWVLR